MTKKCSSWTLALTALTLGMSVAGTANAAIITVANSANASGIASSSTISAFNLGAGNTLAVLIATGDGVASPHSVTFGGVSVNNSISVQEGTAAGNVQTASIFYLINSTTTSGDVVVNFGGNAIYAVTAVSLSNVAHLGDSGTFGEPDAPSFNIEYDGTAGGYALASFVDNDFNNGTPTLTIAGDNIGASDYFQQIDGSTTPAASAGRALAGASIISNGSFTEVFTPGGTNASTRNAGALAAFVAVPVPEPGAICLMIIGLTSFGMKYLLRRRSAVQ